MVQVVHSEQQAEHTALTLLSALGLFSPHSSKMAIDHANNNVGTQLHLNMMTVRRFDGLSVLVAPFAQHL